MGQWFSFCNNINKFIYLCLKFLSKLRKSLACLLDTLPPCKTEAEGVNNLKVYIKAFICDTGIEVSIIEMFIIVKFKKCFSTIYFLNELHWSSF